MRNLFFCFFALFSPICLAETLVVAVNNIASEKGNIVINVYNKEKHWMSKKQKHIFIQTTLPLAGKVKEGVFITEIDLPAGEYGLYIYQDLNMDNEMETNWIGIPKEPVGTSNNAKGSMGPPDYEDAKFIVTTEGAKQSINIVKI